MDKDFLYFASFMILPSTHRNQHWYKCIHYLDVANNLAKRLTVFLAILGTYNLSRTNEISPSNSLVSNLDILRDAISLGRILRTIELLMAITVFVCCATSAYATLVWGYLPSNDYYDEKLTERFRVKLFESFLKRDDIAKALGSESIGDLRALVVCFDDINKVRYRDKWQIVIWQLKHLASATKEQIDKELINRVLESDLLSQNPFIRASPVCVCDEAMKNVARFNRWFIKNAKMYNVGSPKARAKLSSPQISFAKPMGIVSICNMLGNLFVTGSTLVLALPMRWRIEGLLLNRVTRCQSMSELILSWLSVQLMVVLIVYRTSALQSSSKNTVDRQWGIEYLDNDEKAKSYQSNYADTLDGRAQAQIRKEIDDCLSRSRDRENSFSNESTYKAIGDDMASIIKVLVYSPLSLESAISVAAAALEANER